MWYEWIMRSEMSWGETGREVETREFFETEKKEGEEKEGEEKREEERCKGVD
ncbi:hypothetical protein [Streptococcus agalactiae]|uniref:hypothetical protein n=1 Tax=Streptococcus agalactiae TaxID=1311 RepID=UPI00136426DF|nr:hypothetical protein [Streptococcus agalactiae]